MVPVPGQWLVQITPVHRTRTSEEKRSSDLFAPLVFFDWIPNNPRILAGGAYLGAPS